MLQGRLGLSFDRVQRNENVRQLTIGWGAVAAREFLPPGANVCVAAPSSQIGSKKPSPPLEVGPLNPAIVVWESAVSSPIGVWGRASAKIEFGAFNLSLTQVGSNSQGAKQLPGG